MFYFNLIFYINARLVRTTLSGVTTFPIVYAICMGTVAVSPYYTGNNFLFNLIFYINAPLVRTPLSVLTTFPIVYAIFTGKPSDNNRECG